MLSISDGDGEFSGRCAQGASAYMLKSMPKDALLGGHPVGACRPEACA